MTDGEDRHHLYFEGEAATSVLTSLLSKPLDHFYGREVKDDAGRNIFCRGRSPDDSQIQCNGTALTSALIGDAARQTFNQLPTYDAVWRYGEFTSASSAALHCWHRVIRRGTTLEHEESGCNTEMGSDGLLRANEPALIGIIN